MINGLKFRKDESQFKLICVEKPKHVKQFDSESDYFEYLYWTEGLQQLVGQTVVAAEMEPIDYDDSIELSPVLRFDGGDAISMIRDDEGNGPGRYAYF